MVHIIITTIETDLKKNTNQSSDKLINLCKNIKAEIEIILTNRILKITFERNLFIDSFMQILRK